jgi:hypothetical protein
VLSPWIQLIWLPSKNAVPTSLPVDDQANELLSGNAPRTANRDTTRPAGMLRLEPDALRSAPFMTAPYSRVCLHG